MFLLGYYIFSHDHIIQILVKYRYFFLMTAMILGIAYTFHFWGDNYALSENLQKLITNAYAWFMTLALIGWAKQKWDKNTYLTSYMNKRSFGFYVLHYPLLVLTAYIIDSNFTVPSLAFYFILMITEGILLPLSYEILSRIPVIKSLLLGI